MAGTEGQREERQGREEGKKEVEKGILFHIKTVTSYVLNDLMNESLKEGMNE